MTTFAIFLEEKLHFQGDFFFRIACTCIKFGQVSECTKSKLYYTRSGPGVCFSVAFLYKIILKSRKIKPG